MNPLIPLLMLGLLISGCSKKQKQLNNEKYILGDWVKVNTKADMLQPPFFLIPGYTFYANHTCDNKSGYFKYINNIALFNNQSGSSATTIYLGSLSKFKISADSIKIFSLEKLKWNS